MTAALSPSCKPRTPRPARPYIRPAAQLLEPHLHISFNQPPIKRFTFLHLFFKYHFYIRCTLYLHLSGSQACSFPAAGNRLQDMHPKIYMQFPCQEIGTKIAYRLVWKSYGHAAPSKRCRTDINRSEYSMRMVKARYRSGASYPWSFTSAGEITMCGPTVTCAMNGAHLPCGGCKSSKGRPTFWRPRPKPGSQPRVRGQPPRGRPRKVPLQPKTPDRVVSASSSDLASLSQGWQ